MSKRILIADDSVTIQKVIKITLAEQSWDLEVCSSEEQLFANLEGADLLLLDFSLSETRSGYDLVKQVKSESPNTSILMMFGTFDTIDDSALKEAQVDDKVIKPFDSSKFANLCISLTSGKDAEAPDIFIAPDQENGDSDPMNEGSVFDEDDGQSFPSEIDPPTQEIDLSDLNSESEEDLWEIDSSAVADEGDSASEENILDDPLPLNEPPSEDKLLSEIQDWGIEIPGVIGDIESSDNELPPIIGDSTADNESLLSDLPPGPIDDLPSGDSILPVDSDLEYPDLEMGSVDGSLEKLPDSTDLEYPDVGVVSEETLELEGPGEGSGNFDHIKLDADLIPLDQLNSGEEEYEEEFSFGSPPISSVGTDSEEGVKEIQEKIKDEEEEEEFWSVDESAVKETPEVKEASLDDFDEIDRPDFLEEPTACGPSSISMDSIDSGAIAEESLDLSGIEEKMTAELTPIIEKIVRQYCQQTLEKVAWEVIPDLAENIIKQELKKISDDVLSNQ